MLRFDGTTQFAGIDIGPVYSWNFYEPVQWVYDNTPMKPILRRWAELWRTDGYYRIRELRRQLRARNFRHFNSIGPVCHAVRGFKRTQILVGKLSME